MIIVVRQPQLIGGCPIWWEDAPSDGWMPPSGGCRIWWLPHLVDARGHHSTTPTPTSSAHYLLVRGLCVECVLHSQRKLLPAFFAWNNSLSKCKFCKWPISVLVTLEQSISNPWRYKMNNSSHLQHRRYDELYKLDLQVITWIKTVRFTISYVFVHNIAVVVKLTAAILLVRVNSPSF